MARNRKTNKRRKNKNTNKNTNKNVKKVLKVVKIHEKNKLEISTTNKEVINGHKTTIIGRFFIKMSIIS